MGRRQQVHYADDCARQGVRRRDQWRGGVRPVPLAPGIAATTATTSPRGHLAMKLSTPCASRYAGLAALLASSAVFPPQPVPLPGPRPTPGPPAPHSPP